MGHAGNKINDIWQQISRKRVVGMGRNLAGSYSGLVYLTTKTGAFVPGGPLESQNIEGVKKIYFVTLFSKVVSPISMKFGMMGVVWGSRS